MLGKASVQARRGGPYPIVVLSRRRSRRRRRASMSSTIMCVHDPSATRPRPASESRSAPSSKPNGTATSTPPSSPITRASVDRTPPAESIPPRRVPSCRRTDDVRPRYHHVDAKTGATESRPRRSTARRRMDGMICAAPDGDPRPETASTDAPSATSTSSSERGTSTLRAVSGPH